MDRVLQIGAQLPAGRVLVGLAALNSLLGIRVLIPLFKGIASDRGQNHVLGAGCDGAAGGILGSCTQREHLLGRACHSTLAAVCTFVQNRHLVLVGNAVRTAIGTDLVNVIKDINDVLRVHGVTDLQGVGLIPQHVVVPTYRQLSGNLRHTVFGSLAKSHSGTVRQQAAAVKLHAGRNCDNRGIQCDLCLYTVRIYQIVVYRIIRLGLEDVTEGMGLSRSQGPIDRILHFRVHIFIDHIMPTRVAAGITLQRQHSGGNSTFIVNLGLCPVLPSLGLITPLFQWHDDDLGGAGVRQIRVIGDRNPRAAFHLVVNRGLVDVGSIIVVGVQSKIHSHLVIGFRTCNVAVASLIHYNAVEEVVPTGCLPRKIVTGKVRCDRLIRNRRTQLTAARLGHLRIVRVFPTCFGVEVVLHRVRNRIRLVGDSVRNIVLDLSRNTLSQSTLRFIRCSPSAVAVVRFASAGGNILFRQRIAAGGIPLASVIGQNDLDRLVSRTCLRSIPGTIHNRKCHRLDAVLRRGELCLSPIAVQLHAVTVNGDRSTIHGITSAIDLPAAKGIAGDSVSGPIQRIQHFALGIVGINGMLISLVQGCIIRRLLQSMRRATVFIQRSIFRQPGPGVGHAVDLLGKVQRQGLEIFGEFRSAVAVLVDLFHTIWAGGRHLAQRPVVVCIRCSGNDLVVVANNIGSESRVELTSQRSIGTDWVLRDVIQVPDRQVALFSPNIDVYLNT